MRVYARKGLAVWAAVAVGCLLAPSAFTDSQEAQRGRDVIKACVERHSGEARIVAPGRPCRDNETAVVWNIEGPPGPQGPAGEVGATGAPGPSGRDGRDGRDGHDGGTPAAAGPIGTLRIEEIHPPDQPSPILAVSGGLTSADTTGGGAVTFQEIHVTKSVDQFSPKLYMFGALGRHIHSLDIDVFRQGTTDVELSYRLEDVLITSVQQSGGGNQVPVESVSFNFAKIRIAFTPLGGPAVTFCFDVRLGRPC